MKTGFQDPLDLRDGGLAHPKSLVEVADAAIATRPLERLPRHTPIRALSQQAVQQAQVQGLCGWVHAPRAGTVCKC